MKVWEALQILESMDKTLDVTLVFGNDTKKKPVPVIGYPLGHRDFWVKTDELTPIKITCGQLTAYKQ